MTNRRSIVVYVAIFNLLMMIAFIFSNIYIWDFLETQIDQQGGYQGNGVYVIPFIEDIGLDLSVSHIVYAENGTVVNLGTLPTTVPNYPFILFWVFLVGNLVCVTLALRKHIPENT